MNPGQATGGYINPFAQGPSNAGMNNIARSTNNVAPSTSEIVEIDD